MASPESTSSSTFNRVATDLTHAAFPELGAAIRERTPRILEQWRLLTLRAMPQLEALTLEEFEDTIAIILSAAADALQSANPAHLRGVMEEAPSHGVDRFIQEHSLLELFEEVRILRGVVIVEIAEQMRRSLSVPESATFHAIFDIIIQQGVIALVEHRKQDQDDAQELVRTMNGRLVEAVVRHDELLTQSRAMQRQIAEQANALASESRRKDEFLAMLSHELRNPLAPIQAAAYLLRTTERSGEHTIQKQAREIIERQAATMNKLINDLLDVSRVLSGRIRLDMQTLDLSQTLAHAVETTAQLIRRQRHQLVMHQCDKPLWTTGDATRLEQVFVNLLNNAGKYTPDGGRIDVWCEHPEGASHVQVRIRDNGVGIEEALLPRVFDLFTQADRSLARSQGGLGVGLSLVHRLVEMHSGTIEVSSPPHDAQVGTEFIVRLPALPVGDLRPAQIEHEPPAPRIAPQGTRVLLVDDNFDLVLLLAVALRQHGYSVQVAYNGLDGLRVAQEWRPDIVLLDIGLPGLDGYEVARRLRADHTLSKVRLIALTGYGREADLARARDAGFDAHMVKPVDFAALERQMASLSRTNPEA